MLGRGGDGGRRGRGKTAGMPVAWLLSLTLAGLVLLAALPTALLGYFGARDNTARLLRDRAELTLDSVVEPVQARLERMREQLAYVAQAVVAGDVDPADPAAMRPFLLGAMAATPQVARIAHIRPDRRVTFYEREGRDTAEEEANAQAAEQLAVDAAAGSREQRWVGPIWSPTLSEPILTLRQPLTVGGSYAGSVVAAVTVRSLAREVADAAAGLDATPFILLGRDRVLAHPQLASGAWTRPADGALLPALAEVGDPTLAGIWTELNPLTSTAPFRDAEGHWNLGPEGYSGFTYRRVRGFGDEAWLVGFHNPSAQTRRERWIVIGIGLAGLALLALALAVAARVARRLGRPVAELAVAARRVERLDFAAGPLPYRPGPIAEVNAAREAFARMGEALTRVQVYLPRRLALRVLAAGHEVGETELREVTIMFGDLEGFTAFSRGRPAGEVAEFVNGLLGSVGPVIEAAGGTIDKYTGDGVMAFWGAPEVLPDHAARALAAAREIDAVWSAHNAGRRARGQPCCRLRLGLHTGPAIVGDVGFPGRVEYTALGEAVNHAQRLEQRGRGLCRDGEAVVIVASGATLEAAGEAAGDVADGLEPVPGLPPAFRLRLGTAPALAPAGAD